MNLSGKVMLFLLSWTTQVSCDCLCPDSVDFVINKTKTIQRDSPIPHNGVTPVPEIILYVKVKDLNAKENEESAQDVIVHNEIETIDITFQHPSLPNGGKSFKIESKDINRLFTYSLCFNNTDLENMGKKIDITAITNIEEYKDVKIYLRAGRPKCDTVAPSDDQETGDISPEEQQQNSLHPQGHQPNNVPLEHQQLNNETPQEKEQCNTLITVVVTFVVTVAFCGISVWIYWCKQKGHEHHVSFPRDTEKNRMRCLTSSPRSTSQVVDLTQTDSENEENPEDQLKSLRKIPKNNKNLRNRKKSSSTSSSASSSSKQGSACAQVITFSEAQS